MTMPRFAGSARRTNVCYPDNGPGSRSVPVAWIGFGRDGDHGGPRAGGNQCDGCGT